MICRCALSLYFWSVSIRFAVAIVNVVLCESTVAIRTYVHVQNTALEWTLPLKHCLRNANNNFNHNNICCIPALLLRFIYSPQNWKKRWFVLYRNELKYFSGQDSKDPLKVIDLHEVTAVERDDSIGKNYCFK